MADPTLLRERVERTNRWLRTAGAVFFVALTVLVGVGVFAGLRVVDHVGDLADDARRQAERNTELLSVDCDTVTGTPKLVAGKEYVNSRTLLDAHCARERERAIQVAGYITSIGEQIGTSEDNVIVRIDTLEKALLQRRPTSTPGRIPIPHTAPTRRTTTTSARSTTTTSGAKVPAPAPAATPAPQPPPPPTTTTCPAKGKRPENCK